MSSLHMETYRESSDFITVVNETSGVIHLAEMFRL